jgi:hypothetical protein
VRAILASVLFTALCCTAADGQTSRIGFTAGGGIGNAFGELAELANPGYHAVVGIRLQPSQSAPDIAFVPTAGWHTFRAENDDSPDVTFITAGLELRLCARSAPSTRVYLIGGGGYAKTTVDEYNRFVRVSAPIDRLELVPELDEDNYYLSAGVGVLVGKPGKLNGFIEIRAANVFGTRIKNYTFVPILVGVAF